MGLTEVNGTGEADMKESHGNNNKDACGSNGASEPKADGGKCVEPDSIVGGTTERLGNDLPAEYNKSEDITSGDPEMGLVRWRQFFEVGKTKF